MTDKDREAVRQMLSDVIALQTADLHKKLDLTIQELGFVKEQTTKTNGRVTKHDEVIRKLELEDANHLAKCPNMKRIEGLENDQSERGGALKFIRFAGWILFSVSALVIAWLELFKQ